MAEPRYPRLRGLIVDYGGVLTTPVTTSMSVWAGEDGVDEEEFRAVLAQWFGATYGDESADSPLHAMERGEITVAAFERELAARLRTRSGGPVGAEGLVARMFAGFEREPVMYELVRAARAAGLRTCLLSNSWGDSYSRDDWPELFDAVVISGEVGMRKPEPRIYHLALRRLGLPAGECVFVDDIPVNTSSAAQLGMVGITHESPERTAEELEAAVGLRLR